MKRWLGWTILSLLLVVPCYSQDATQAARETASGTKITFAVTLEKSLDSKKLKEGDPVICATSGTLHGRNGFLIPSGSKVLGHITQAQARGKGDANSTLAIAFDKIQVRGEQLAMSGTPQAIAPSLNDSGPTTGPAEPGSMGGGGRGAGAGGSGSTGGATSPAPTSTMKISSANGTPVLVPTSQGALGMKNVEMDSAGVITSSGKQVKLDNGTQMMIRGEIQMPVQ